MHDDSEYWRPSEGDQCLIEKAYLDFEKLTTAPDVFRMSDCDPTYIVPSLPIAGEDHFIPACAYQQFHLESLLDIPGIAVEAIARAGGAICGGERGWAGTESAHLRWC